MSTQVQNKPTAAFILSLLGGIIGLLTSLVFMVLGATAFVAYNDWMDSYGGYYYDYYASDALFGWSWSILIGVGIWMLITSILIIIFARKLNANPMQHTKYGALILIFSIIGVGGLFGLIGGILALIYKPIPYGSQPMYQQPYGVPQQSYTPPPPTYAQPVQQQTNRICPQCGRFTNEDTKFCPNCGKQLA